MKILFKGVLLICMATMMVACDNEKIQQEKDGDKISISLTFSIANSPLSIGGPMAVTKGTAEGIFDVIYEGIVSGEIVAAYELTFTNKSTGATTIFNGRWNDGKTISIEKGSYTITGACTAAGNGIYNQCSLTLQDEATITEQTTTVKIKAQYDCSLLILNDETVDKVVYYANENDSTNFAKYKTLTYAFLKSAADFTQSGEAFLKVYFKNGKNNIVSLGQINIQKGKYYLLENLNNYTDAGLVLDIDKMENGGEINSITYPSYFETNDGLMIQVLQKHDSIVSTHRACFTCDIRTGIVDTLCSYAQTILTFPSEIIADSFKEQLEQNTALVARWNITKDVSNPNIIYIDQTQSLEGLRKDQLVPIFKRIFRAYDESWPILKIMNLYGPLFLKPIEFSFYQLARNANAFIVGESVSIWGYQNKTNGVIETIFENQEVISKGNDVWAYENTQYWNFSPSYYEFYGAYPYSKTLYTLSEDDGRYISIPQYTVPNDPADQIDLMISKTETTPLSECVDMNFYHLLSKVNIYAKISDGLDTTGIANITIKNIKINNIHSTGHYEQTGWNQDRAEGAWTNVRNYMQIPAKTDVVITKAATALYKDYLMIPQVLFSTDSRPKDASVDATFKITYKDGTTSTYIKNGIRLAGITGTSKSTSKAISSWQPNYCYNYTLSFNPQMATRIWEADGDGSIQIDPVTGDTITKTDDTPFPGIIKYNPDEPDKVYVYKDTDGDGKTDTWILEEIIWEDVDGDGKLEAGFDRDGDGHIDNVDGDNDTQQLPGGNPVKDPSDGNPNNPDGKDVILIHYDSDYDGDVDDDDEWIQLQKDIITGDIKPYREVEDATVIITVDVSYW